MVGLQQGLNLLLIGCARRRVPMQRGATFEEIEARAHGVRKQLSQHAGDDPRSAQPVSLPHMTISGSQKTTRGTS